MRRSLTGIQPSGDPHIGNLKGMIEPAVALQATHEPFYFIASYHALTTLKDPDLLRAYQREAAISFLAYGLDPQKTALFLQQDVPEVTELSFILSCFVNMGVLERAHAYKSAREAGREVNLGTVSYPVLMAADILIYDSHDVPVGKDQKQHVEMARDIAIAFMHKVDPGPNGLGLYIELDGGTALLDIYDDFDGGSADHWAFIYVRIYERGSVYEEEIEDNDDADFANTLDVDWTEGDGYGRSRGWGTMDYNGDSDWYTFEVDEQNYLLVDGTADSLGSEIDGGIEVYDIDGNLLSIGEPDEDQFDDTPEWIGPLNQGFYFVRVFAQNGGAAGPGFYYRFTAYQTDSP